MKLITLLSDQNFNSQLITPERSGYRVRTASRALLLNHNNEVALLWVGKHKVYKLPGGGIEEGEDITIGLKREILEETGCIADITEEVGLTIEFRDEWGMVQISHCYKTIVLKNTGANNLMDDEKADQFSLQWVPLSSAITMMDSHTSPDYDAQFMQKRDLAILKTALM